MRGWGGEFFAGIAAMALITPGLALDYREPVAISPEFVGEVLNPALMCLAAYTDDAKVDGWDGPEATTGGQLLDDPVSGFRARLYADDLEAPTVLVLAFRGTDMTSFADWKNNFIQGLLGRESEQYRIARRASQELKMRIIMAGRAGLSLRGQLTGHSLGGGMAAYGALCWKIPAVCFGSAALGREAQSMIEASSLVGLRQAPTYVTQIFVEGDSVPDLSGLLGGHFGRILTPELAPSVNRSGEDTNGDRARMLLLAGLIPKGQNWFANGGLLSTARTVNTVLDKAARHSMSNYISALMLHASQSGGGISLPGFWQSAGGIPPLSESNTSFFLYANGAARMKTKLTFLKLKPGGIGETGRWEFDGRTLRLTLGGIVTVVYEWVSAHESKIVQWRRTEVRVNDAEFLRIAGASGEDPTLALLAFKGVCSLMRDQDVTWTQSTEEYFTQLLQ
jgi:hypothetical protein